jgi:hypothetical protein
MVVSIIAGGNRSIWGKPQTCCKSLTNFITKCCIEFKITMLVVIGTDCTCSCKSNYHPIATTTNPYLEQCLGLRWVYNSWYYLATRWRMFLKRSKLDSYILITLNVFATNGSCMTSPVIGALLWINMSLPCLFFMFVKRCAPM